MDESSTRQVVHLYAVEAYARRGWPDRQLVVCFRGERVGATIDAER